MGFIQNIKEFMFTQGHEEEKTTVKPEEEKKGPSLDHTLQEFKDCMDLVQRTYPECKMNIVYLTYLTGIDELTQEIVRPFSSASEEEAEQILL
ncbi:hypothetical protein [Paenibacillus dokdonensis]|uniref:hypothetical protein n=1 Tax=Paenibacillus dokdonensis TaxID=2567944 RepID=UPI0010A8A6A3|nr:hypothetical protein [Paenibacillus dokdonensis]